MPYLAELRVSHVYGSPFLRVRPGSRHGYDVVDHNALNPEIGRLEDLDRLVAALLSAFAHLSPRSHPDPAARAGRNRDKKTLKARLAQLVREHAPLAQAIEHAVARLRVGGPGGGAGVLAALDRLDALIQAQAYRLAYWRVAAGEINYCRFFGINDLAALRTERREVFDDLEVVGVERCDNSAVTLRCCCASNALPRNSEPFRSSRASIGAFRASA